MRRFFSQPKALRNVFYALAFMVSVGSGCAVKKEQPTSVILITIDSLRADHVSFNGYDFDTTPFLDRLSQDSVVFQHAYTPSPSTGSSIASLFTSHHPSSHGVTTGAQDEVGGPIQPVLSQKFVTLAEMLKAKGFVTIAVVSSMSLAREYGFDQGFDHYFGGTSFLNGEETNRAVQEQLAAAFGKEWRTAWKEQKVFLWVHYFDPHAPYAANPSRNLSRKRGFDRNKPKNIASLSEGDKRSAYRKINPATLARLTSLYDDEIFTVDSKVKSLFGDLGPNDSTLIIATSDHGEELGEHGNLGHGHTLFEEVVHVPLLMFFPPALSRGLSVDEPVSLIDVYPTIADIIDTSTDASLQGTSLLPFVTFEKSNFYRYRPYFELDIALESRRAYIDWPWKIISGPMDGKNTELYDLEEDPSEQSNLASEKPVVAGRLLAELFSYGKTLPRAGTSDAVRSKKSDVPEDYKSLGYRH
jgi:arylsulfatase A-like enzyme